MSEYTYSYSLSDGVTGFGGNLDSSQFHSEIDADTGITGANLLRVDTAGDDVDTVFDGALSAGEQTTLDGLVTAHTPSVPRVNFYNETPRIDSTNSTTYKKLSSFKYGGSDQIGTINYIDVISYKDSSVTSYDLKMYDKTNNQIIAESTGLTNTSSSINDLGTISNIPTAKAIFEIQAKRTGGSGNDKNVYVDQVIIYYNN